MPKQFGDPEIGYNDDTSSSTLSNLSLADDAFEVRRAMLGKKSRSKSTSYSIDAKVRRKDDNASPTLSLSDESIELPKSMRKSSIDISPVRYKKDNTLTNDLSLSADESFERRRSSRRGKRKSTSSVESRVRDKNDDMSSSLSNLNLSDGNFELRSAMRGKSKSTCSIDSRVSFMLPPPEPPEPLDSFDDNERHMMKLETAAAKIQEGFRQQCTPPKKKKEKKSRPQSTNDEIPEQKKRDMTPFYKLVYLVAFSIGMVVLRFVNSCFGCCRRSEDKQQTGEEVGEILVDGSGQASSRRGPPADSTAPAASTKASSVANTMAAQAGASATKGLASGVAASMAAAGGTAITTAQVAVLIVITGAVVGSSVVVVPTLLSPLEPTPISPFISTCGTESPVFHDGTIGLLFVGVGQEVDGREQQMIEVLMVDSYNEVTIGMDPAMGCVDEYLREMQNSTLIDQSLLLSSENGVSTLDMTFDAWLICDGCPNDLPTFGRFAAGSDSNRTGGSTDTIITGDELNTVIDESLIEDCLKRLVTKIIELTESGELPASLIPSRIIATVPHIPTLEDEEVDDSSTNETVLIDLPVTVNYGEQDGYSVHFDDVLSSAPPTANSLFSVAPSDEPSLRPSTMAPSAFPSLTMSGVPSDSPSASPSVGPSEGDVLTGSPSVSNNDFLISGRPTDQPSSSPTESPSTQSSSGQDGTPSTNPPSINPVATTGSPSSTPAIGSPSASPVTASPSTSPVVVSTPTKAPTSRPSASPSDSPSVRPTVAPTDRPSASPSLAPSTSFPSQNPSEMPSTQYLGCFSDTPAMDLSIGAGPYTVATCQSDCNDFGYRHAGLQPSAVSGNQCFCGDSYVSSNQVADSQCNNACGGSCGGTDRNSVYMTGNAVGGGFSFSPSMYCSCRDDNPLSRDLPVRISEYMSVKGCIAGCENNGYKYAGLQNGRECWCGNLVNGATNVGGCTNSCVFGAPPGCLGGGACYCGATDVNAIYRTSTSIPCPS